LQILIVDDEKSLVKGLKYTLEREGFEVYAAYDGQEALDFLRDSRVDIIILDLMLPRVDGLAVCRRIRQQGNKTPIIMLTAKGDDVDKIIGLELGADDYMAKPFNPRELVARIRAVLRRATATAQTGILKFGELHIDLDRRLVTVKGKTADLSVREFDLLITMARRPGFTFTREMLLEQVWGHDYFGDTRVVDVYIRRVREKIEPDPAHPRWIITRWGVGYAFEGEAQKQ
jgi:two-component system response regulator VicR